MNDVEDVEKLTARQIKERIRSFDNLSDAYDWLERTNKLDYFKWFLSSIVFERLGGVKPVGFEIHHITPLEDGYTKDVLLNPDNFAIVSKKGHKKLEQALLWQKKAEKLDKLKEWVDKQIRITGNRKGMLGKSKCEKWGHIVEFGEARGKNNILKEIRNDLEGVKDD